MKVNGTFLVSFHFTDARLSDAKKTPLLGALGTFGALDGNQKVYEVIFRSELKIGRDTMTDSCRGIVAKHKGKAET